MSNMHHKYKPRVKKSIIIYNGSELGLIDLPQLCWSASVFLFSKNGRPFQLALELNYNLI